MNEVAHRISASATKAPDHVPPDMIRDHEIYYLPGSKTDTFGFLRGIHEDSDIFYNLNADPIVCPNGAWYVTSYELMSKAFQDTELFSNREQSKYGQLVGEDWAMIPVELDAPELTRIRMVVMPMFSPARMKLLNDRIIERSEELIAKVRDRGECDFVAEFSSVLPVNIFLELLDLPFERFSDFSAWGHGIINSFLPEERIAATRDARAYLREVIVERQNKPGDGIISAIVQARAGDGKPLTDDELIGLAFMLFVGGLDTVAATLGFTFRYLADHPEAQAQLRKQPDLIRNAVEEFLRAFSVVQSKRKVTRDVVFHGAPLKAGDYVTCVTGLADTDPEEFGDGMQLERQNNRHIAFGMGPHRCLGSHLARLELKLVIETWLKAIPEFEVTPGAQITTHGAGGVYGYDTLPLRWNKGGAK